MATATESGTAEPSGSRAIGSEPCPHLPHGSPRQFGAVRKSLSALGWFAIRGRFNSSLAHKSASDYGKYRKSAGGENLSPIVCFLGLHRLWQGVMPGVGGPGRRREGVFCLVGGARSPCAECIPHGFPTRRPGWFASIGGDPEPLCSDLSRMPPPATAASWSETPSSKRGSLTAPRCPSRRGRRLTQAQLSGRAGTARMGVLARVSNLVLARRRSVTVTRSSTSRAW